MLNLVEREIRELICSRGTYGLKEGMVEAFQNLLSENGEWWPIYEGLVFNELGAAETDCLEAPFSVEEVHIQHYFNLLGDKTIGPMVCLWPFGHSIGMC